MPLCEASGPQGGFAIQGGKKGGKGKGGKK